jgi:hypothetical protein
MNEMTRYFLGYAVHVPYFSRPLIFMIKVNKYDQLPMPEIDLLENSIAHVLKRKRPVVVRYLIVRKYVQLPSMSRVNVRRNFVLKIMIVIKVLGAQPGPIQYRSIAII